MDRISGLSDELLVKILLFVPTKVAVTATIKSSELEVPKFEMLKELSLSSRASAACQLMFE
ncbi:hypothetical protein F2Q69_00061860 [Brassica cretica]|uniref:F-box domain-containing protein n=1 Tax=Brassica cretica TaxID=69181 RepID=A0A8S9RKI3_BRACR|nr:hypothetical protein F2Q69_00061860 [Brassica cretica]